MALLHDPRARKYHTVRRALAGSPFTPRPEAMALLATLFWKDLAWLSVQVRTHPEIRRAADKELLRRFAGLALAERRELAASAGRGIIAALRGLGEPPVMESLLRNRLTTEADACTIAVRTREPGILEILAADPRWSVRSMVCAAIVHNPACPVALAVRLLPWVPLADVREVGAGRGRAEQVRQAAHEILRRRVEDGAGLH